MIYFLVEWQKDKSRTWSGTCLGLYKALSKRIDIIDVDINISENAITRLYHKIIKELGFSDMCIGKMKKQRDKVRQIVKPNNHVFQFAEVMADTADLPTFIFQDLSVSYVKHMADNMPDIFRYSSYQRYSKESIGQRVIIQGKYYQNCAGIFTMGKWFAQDLIERCGLPPHKVHPVGGG